MPKDQLQRALDALVEREHPLKTAANALERTADFQEKTAKIMKWSLIALAATAFFTFLVALATFIVPFCR